MKEKRKNKKINLPFISFVMVFLLFFATNVFAEDEFYNEKTTNNDISVFNPKFDDLKGDDPSLVSKVDCFDYYKFQSVQVNINADKEEYQSGKIIKFIGNLVNENNQPITNGEVFVRISRKDIDNSENWGDIVDEFFPLEKISLKPKETKDIAFLWGIPKGITNGDYKADFFFTVGKKFNLGGLSFSNEVIIGSADFKIKTDNNNYIKFDRSKTKINGKTYHQIGNWPVIDKNSSAKLTQVIKNTFSEPKEVKLFYDLYDWDGLNEKNKIKTDIEKITIPAQSEKEISYIFPKMNTSVYFLRITAVAGNQKSIINIRLVSPQEKPRLNYPAITSFPKKGEKATLYTCFHNTSVKNTTGRVVVTLTDENNKEIAKINYQGNIPSAMFADKTDFVAKKNYKKINLKAEVYDKNGNKVDSYETTYNCEDFDICPSSNDEKPLLSDKIEKTGNFLKTWKGAMIAIFIIIIIGTITVVVLNIKKNRKEVEK